MEKLPIIHRSRYRHNQKCFKIKCFQIVTVSLKGIYGGLHLASHGIIRLARLSPCSSYCFKCCICPGLSGGSGSYPDTAQGKLVQVLHILKRHLCVTDIASRSFFFFFKEICKSSYLVYIMAITLAYKH